VGRSARLELRFERRGGATKLVDAYVEPPFCVRRAFDVGGAAYVIIVCSGPGIFGGDTIRQTIHLGAGARAVLTSQSSLQVHPSACGSAAQIDQQFTVEDEGELHGEWDPVIPFADSRVVQRTLLRLAPTARLWWSDAVMAGRIGRGERWRFRDLAHELRLEVARSLVYLERYRLAPSEKRLDARWIASDATHIGTALARHPRATGDLAEEMHAQMRSIPRIEGAADAIDPHLILARCMAPHGIPFASARRACRRVAFERLFESHPPAWRKSV
jgi:urease accessory protein UreH